MMEYIKLKTIEEYVEEYRKYTKGLDYSQIEEIEIICKYFPRNMKKNESDIGYKRKDNMINGNKGIVYEKKCHIRFMGNYIDIQKDKYQKLIKCKEYEQVVNHIKINILDAIYINLDYGREYIKEDLYTILQYTVGNMNKVMFPPITDSLSSKVNFPFEDCSVNTAKFVMPLKDILGKEKYITVFNMHDKVNERKRLDVHGYWKLRQCKQEIQEEINQNNNIENYLLLEEILGISMTNTVFWITKEADRVCKERIFRIAGIIARLKNRYARIVVSELVLTLLMAIDFEKNICSSVEVFLIEMVDNYNNCYDEMCLYIIGGMYADTNLSVEMFMEDIELTRGNIISTEDIYDEKISQILSNKEIRATKGVKSNEEYYAQLHIEIMRSIWREKSQGVGLKKKMNP